MVVKWLGILIVAMALPAGNAATYYVSELGSDSNSGSEAAPLLTVSHAVSLVAPGDTIQLASGHSFDEVVRTGNSVDGTEWSPVTVLGGAISNSRVFRWDHSKPYWRFERITFGKIATDPVSTAIFEFQTGAHYNIISNCVFAGIGTSGSTALKIALGVGVFDVNAGSHNLVVSNTFYGIKNTAVWEIAGTQNRFIGNLSRDSWNVDWIRLFGQNNLISGNTFTNMMPIPEGEKALGHPDFVQTFGNRGKGSRGHVFERNVLADHQGQITQLVEGTAADSDLIGTGALGDWTFRNNIFCNTKLGSSITIPDTKWYNNVFYKVNTSGGGALGGSQSDRGTSAGIRILNNVFLDCGIVTQDNTGWYRVNFDYVDRVHDYNYVAKNNYGPVREECPIPNEYRWCEDNGINGGDPLFVDAANYDFRLLAGSPLIGAGTNFVALFNDDHAGNERITWDIGAFAYDSANPPTTPPPAPPPPVDTPNPPVDFRGRVLTEHSTVQRIDGIP